MTREQFLRRFGFGTLAAVAAPMVLVKTALAAGDFTDPVTGFTVTGRFAQFYNELGDHALRVFGRPTGPAQMVGSLLMQRFERARFELHTENAYPYDVLLSIADSFPGEAGSCASGNAGSRLAQVQPGPMAWPFSLPHDPNLDALPSASWGSAPRGQWFHPLFRPDWFHGPDWNGAWSWFTTFAILREVNCRFRDNVNSGEASLWISDSYFEVEFAVLTTAKYLGQFLSGQPGPAQLNIRGVPGSSVSLCGPDGRVRVSADASDMGDVSVNFPDQCRVTAAIAGRIHDQNGELFLRIGPTGRKVDIDVINGPDFQW